MVYVLHIHFSLGMTQTISNHWIHRLCILLEIGQATPGKDESTALNLVMPIIAAIPDYQDRI